ncbi:MAG: hypothetical protein D6683_07275 [Actinomyces sp.]|nr:MAG: hypothetical protein D6683_07275 [Actinomyces sp.]
MDVIDPVLPDDLAARLRALERRIALLERTPRSAGVVAPSNGEETLTITSSSPVRATSVWWWHRHADRVTVPLQVDTGVSGDTAQVDLVAETLDFASLPVIIATRTGLTGLGGFGPPGIVTFADVDVSTFAPPFYVAAQMRNETGTSTQHLYIRHAALFFG